MIKLSDMNVQQRIFLHGFLCLIGLFPALIRVAEVIGPDFAGQFPDQVFYHMKPFFYPEKKFELAGYLISSAFVAIYFLLIVASANLTTVQKWFARWEGRRPIIHCAVVLVINLTPCA